MKLKSLRSLLLTFTILVVRSVSAHAQPLELRAVCFGFAEGVKVRVALYADNNDHNEINLVVEESSSFYNRSLLLKKSDLAIKSASPIIIKSLTSSPEIYVNMSPTDAEYQGFYVINNAYYDFSLPLSCKIHK